MIQEKFDNKELIGLVKKKLQELGIEYNTYALFEGLAHVYIDYGIYKYNIYSINERISIFIKLLTNEIPFDEEYITRYEPLCNESPESFIDRVFKEQDNFSIDKCKAQYKELMESEYQEKAYKYFTFLAIDSSTKKEFFNKLRKAMYEPYTDEEELVINKFLNILDIKNVRIKILQEKITELEKQMNKKNKGD